MILFDFDGTLTKNLDMVYELWKEFGKKLGVKLSKQEFRKNNNPQWQAFVKQAFKTDVTQHETLFKKIIIDAYRKEILKEKLVPQLVDYLKNEEFGVVTSGFSPAVKKVMQIHNLKPRILISSDEAGTSDKTILLKHALKKVKAEWYVCDTQQDIKAAHDNGLKAASVTWGFHTRQRLLKAKPEKMFAKPEQLIRFLKNLAAQNG